MPEFTAKTTIEIEITFKAKNTDFVQKKVDDILIDVNLGSVQIGKKGVEDIWISSEQEMIDWEIEEI